MRVRPAGPNQDWVAIALMGGFAEVENDESDDSAVLSGRHH